MPSLHNEMILASAGSGKTYQLTNRYIGLMAMQLLAERPVTLGIYAVIKRMPLPRRQDWPLISLCGLTGFTLYNVFL
ncbi:MAG: hypothetical protein AAF491_11580, partial [Verrucomicrobiota bacterium]